jgi:hypothetical protein
VGEKNVEGIVWTVTEQGIWRKRTKKELEEFYKTPHLLMDIKRRRLKFLEHVIKWMKQE